MTLVDEMTLDAVTLKRIRARAGLTQQEVATKTGLSIALVVALDPGRKDNPRLDTLRKQAKGLGCTVGELVGDEGPKARKPKGGAK